MSTVRKFIIIYFNQFIRWRDIVQGQNRPRPTLNEQGETANGDKTYKREILPPPSNHPGGTDLDSDRLSDDNILSAVHKKLQNKAGSILAQLHLISNFVAWDKQGQLIVQGGKLVPESNIIDLVRMLIISTRYKIDPAGSAVFFRMLKLGNFPATLITNTFHKECYQNLYIGGADQSEGDYSFSPPGEIDNKSAKPRLLFSNKKSMTTTHKPAKWIKLN